MNVFLVIMSLFFAKPNMPIFDFSKTCDLTNWYVVNDGVMGGLSQGSLSINEEGHGLFQGDVSLKNNGGFTSIRLSIDPFKIKGKSKLVLKVKGDGKRYQFRVKNDRNERHSYIYHFETSGEWETIEIPLKEMKPSFRGYMLDKPNFQANMLSDISILISNKKQESFQLEMDEIVLE